jgi:hypothetical protein
VSSRPASAQHLRDLALLRRVRDRIAYGVRDCAFREPAGHVIRIQELA